MRSSRQLFALGALSSALFTACDQKPTEEPAAALETPAEEVAKAPVVSAPAGAVKSPHFDAVTANLDFGGTFFGYMDVAGDLDGLLDRAQRMLGVVKNEGAPIPDIQIKDLVNELGLQSITALGASSLPTENDRYRNQAFIHTPGGAKGLLTLFGKEAKPLTALKTAPAETDIAYEQEFNLAALKDIALGIHKQLPPEMGVPPIDQMMQQPVPGIDMTVEEILDKANGRAVFLAQFHPDQKVTLPMGPQPVTIPAVDFLLELQNMGWVFEKLQAMLPPGPFQVEKGDGFTKISVPIPAEAPFSFFQPLLYHDEKANSLILASRPEYIEACKEGNGDKLPTNATFQSLSEKLPTEGNSFSYISDRVKGTVTGIVKDIISQQGAPAAASQMVDMFVSSISASAGVTANRPDGIYVIANSAQSFKSSLIGGAIGPLIAAGVAARSASQVEVNRAMQMDRAQANAVAGAAQVEEAPVARAADNMAGMEQAISALRLYAIQNNGKFPEGLAELTPTYLSQAEASTALQWPSSDGPTALVYFGGLTVATEGNPIVLASPQADSGGLRAVAKADGTTAQVTEDEFFKLARAAIERAAP